MSNRTVDCCVCDRPIEGKVHALGRRSYCATHFARVTQEGRGAARPILLLVGGVVAFAMIVALLAGALHPAISGLGLVLVGIGLAIVPALIWLVAFYLQDRLEPEPKHYVLGVFALGGLLAQAIGQPVIRDLFGVQNWLGADLVTTLVGSILVVGVVQGFLTYAAVRYTVFHLSEFDERVDGIIYGSAAGLGYATALNIQYVVANGGVDLGVGVVHVAVAALAHGTFGGVLGYFLGRARFESMGPLWLPMGLLVVAVLNGVVDNLLDVANSLGGLDFNPWYGLALATIVAGGTFVILFTTIRRLNAASLATSVA